MLTRRLRGEISEVSLECVSYGFLNIKLGISNFQFLSTVAPINKQLRAKARFSADNLSFIQKLNIFDRMEKMNVKKDLESHVKANLALLHLQHLQPLLLSALLLLQLRNQPLVPEILSRVSILQHILLSNVGTSHKRFPSWLS